jgi:hypothetical protein
MTTTSACPRRAAYSSATDRREDTSFRRSTIPCHSLPSEESNSGFGRLDAVGGELIFTFGRLEWRPDSGSNYHDPGGRLTGLPERRATPVLPGET